MPNRMLIADDHELFRRGLRDLLGDEFEVVGEARDGHAAVDESLRLEPDVVVMDLKMPGIDGIEATRRIKTQLPSTAVVIVSAVEDDQSILEAIEAGVSAYALKGDDPATILEAVHNAAEGSAYLPPAVTKRVLDRIAQGLSRREFGTPASLTTPLTPLEADVLRLMAMGKRNREIAAELSVSPRTVSNYMLSIFRKLGIQDRAQAIAYAIRSGIVQL